MTAGADTPPPVSIEEHAKRVAAAAPVCSTTAAQTVAMLLASNRPARR